MKLLKKLSAILLAVILLFSGMPMSELGFEDLFSSMIFASASEYDEDEEELDNTQKDFVYGDFIYSYTESGDITIKKYMGNETTVTVPATIDGKTVVSLGAYSFSPTNSYKNSYTKEKFSNPDSVNVESIILPDSITEIGADSFTNCENLKHINLPKNLKSIRHYAFRGCSSLESLELPHKISSIHNDAFNGAKIKNLTIVSEESFYAKSYMLRGSTIENLTIKAKSITIEANSIVNECLKNIQLEGNITIRRSGITSSTLETLTLVGTVEAIEEYAITSIALKAVTFDAKTLGIASAAFGNQKSETLPETVIVNNYFTSDICEVFEEYLNYDGEITFNDSVKQLVFKQYVEPSEIFTEDIYQYYINENGEAVIHKFLGKFNSKTDVYVPDTLGGAPVTVIGRRSFECLDDWFGLICLPDTVKRIENDAFANSTFISKIRISPNLEYIGYRAFADIYNLHAIGYYDSFDDVIIADVVLPDTVEFIAPEAFRGCYNLFNIKAPGVTAVYDSAFRETRMHTADFSEDFYWVGDYAFCDSNFKQLNHSENITYIGEKAFCNSNLTEFRFNEAITEIQNSAFSSTDIESLVLPSTVKSIGASAFSGCDLLKTVVIPDSVTAIGEYAFSGCKSMESLQLSNKLTNIGKATFKDCEALESVEIPDSVVSIGESAFENCKSAKSISIPNTLTVIEDATFKGCEALASVEIPDSVTTIGKSAFYNCKALVSLDIPDSVVTIYHQAFENCTALKNLKLSESLEVIYTRGFCNCSALENLDLPDSVKGIANNAFAGCSSLTGELTIPKNITSISSNAFSGTGYSVLNYNAANCKAEWTPFKGMNKLETIKLGDNVTSISRDTFRECKTVKNIIVCDSITKIADYAFDDCTNVESITLPETLSSIGYHAFYNCLNVKEFTIPKGLTVLGGYALPKNLTTLYYNAESCEFNEDYPPFSYLTLTEVIIGENVKRIPNDMFRDAKSIENVVISDSVTEIGEFAFSGSAVKSVKLPSKLIVIEYGAFSDSDIKIEGNALPDGLRIIGDYAFSENSGIEELYIPDSVVDIATGAFRDCTNLKKVKMSSSVKLIASYAFYNCTALEEFTWNSDIKLIADYAFYNCRALKNFNFAGVELVYPNSFKSSGVTLVTLGHDKNDEATDLIMVETQSFMGCENLDTVAIGGNVTTIKSEAFASCSNLETAVISDSVINIAPNAFDNCDSLTIYCEEGSYAQKFAIKNDIPVSTFVVAPIPNQTYTGSAIEPEIDVSVSGEKVMENTDFTVKYSDNINVGTAKVNVSGKGVYKVLSSIANFTIITKSIAPVTFAEISEQDYTGEAVIPTITVTDGNKVLKEGVDYTVTYKNNINEGTATATIQGIGNYHGSASMNFEIRELSTSQSIGNMIIDFFTSFWLKIVSFFTSIFG